MVANNGSKVQFNVYLPAELVRELKHRAIDEGVSLSSLVEHVMSTYLSGDETAPTEGERP
ncbi:CopG family transcriptional regulator [Curtobacterium sp. MCBD17_040]|uniref:ribbon-helix-helix domain-containing protein n=1 Tax=Curtobacterium sp. MCBD17_040 TaxID=2175674 RepID=UPI000DA79800|nr:CopG family transcriptional regulator [Curtobacterium sp. MCBD17_040]WIB64708.1 CopG family transcriptional regulator [Curtobacterium sp. MCBD17_040]